MELKEQSNQNFIIKEAPGSDSYCGDYELFHVSGKKLVDFKIRDLGVPMLSDEISFYPSGCYVKLALKVDPETSQYKYEHLFYDNDGKNRILLRDANINHYGYFFNDIGMHSLKFLSGGVEIRFNRSTEELDKYKIPHSKNDDESAVYLHYRDLKKLIILSDRELKQIIDNGEFRGVKNRLPGVSGLVQ